MVFRFLWVRDPPVFADAQVDFEWNREAQLFADSFHLLFHQPLCFLQIMVRHFKDQLVVDLEDHLYVRQFVVKLFMNIDHGDFDQVRGRALDRAVHGHALAEASLCGVAALEFGNRPAAAKDGGGIALLPSFRDVPVHEGPYGGESLKEGVDVLLRFGLRDAEVLREAERADAIDDAEDNGLGRAAHVSRDLAGREPEDFHGGSHVDVLAFGEDRQ